MNKEDDHQVSIYNNWKTIISYKNKIKSTPFICGLTTIDSFGNLSLGGNLTLRDSNSATYYSNTYQ